MGTLIQQFTLKINDQNLNYSINEKTLSCYEIDLNEGSIWSGGNSPQFEKAEDAFLFILKIVKWFNSTVSSISTDGTFLKEQDIKNLLPSEMDSVLVQCY